MSQELVRDLIKIAKFMGGKFTLNNSPVSMEEVFSDTGLLPALARRADQLSSLCLGYGIGVTFEDADGAKLGTKVKFDGVTPNSLRYLMIIDVLNEIMRNKDASGVTALDELMYD
ncbi:MAG: type IV secretion IcmS family protein [Gammaproteobacteria bacterium]